ncbi:MAG: InlB B-repeat-containing protein, partial [Bacilli bacterium]|nr:InlB B-repeat-containing protein [Bacilli bacterium]
EIVLENATGIYYLIVSACDVNGNCTKEISNPFYVDNKEPYGILDIISDTNSITASVNAVDEGSGIKEYGYLIQTDDVCPTSGYIMSEDSEYIFNVENNTTNYICVKVIDNVGNTKYLVSDEIIVIIPTDYSYSGSYKEYIVPADGYYQIEAWGASGGQYSSYASGKGGYSSGIIYLQKDESIYIYVGGLGSTGSNAAGGYNGGGKAASATSNGGGGGATDVRFFGDNEITADTLLWNSTLGLNSRIMVAGGGGGSAEYSTYYGQGGSSGGLIGIDGTSTYNSERRGGGGLQSGTGYRYSGNLASFGIGGSRDNSASVLAGGGGSGYYGGSSGGDYGSGGGGGSSFISGYAGVNAITSSTNRTHTNNTFHYSGKYFINGKMQGGVNSGNGKAKITYLGNQEPKRVNKLFDNVRYIKDCINGNSYNTENHWVELQAIKNGINIAYNKAISGTSSDMNNTTWSYSNIVDGLMDNSTGSSGFGYASATGLQCVTIDLEANYDLDEIAVWHYFNDGRTYNNNVTYVSSDNSNWKELIKTTEAETSNGKRVNVWNNTFIPSDDDYENIILTYNNNGGNGCDYDTLTVGNPYGELCTPIRNGYHFDGWYTIKDGSTKITEDTIVRVTENQTLYANWIRSSNPNIEFEIYGNDRYVSGNISNVINVHKGENNLDTSTFKYIWSTDANAEPNISFTSGEEITLENVTGIYYLIAKVCDVSGICVRKVSNEFYIDNTPPSGTVSASLSNNVISATISASDAETGLATTDTYSWALITDGICDSSTTGTFVSNTNSNYTFTLSSSGTFYVCVKVTDNVGNFDYILSSGISYATNTTYSSAKSYTYTVPVTGYYLLEVWGGQGGVSSGAIGTYRGYGGYAKGIAKLNEGEILYIYVGGQGSGTTGGYNGGGNGYAGSMSVGGGGGGATHIATRSGLLSSLSSYKDTILIVAGGGGSGNLTDKTGHGGGYQGTGTGGENPATGGTQTSGFAFGKGFTATGSSDFGGAGGGGGYYGGKGFNVNGGSAGGSGYIGSSRLIANILGTVKTMYCYNCAESTATSTKTVSTSNYSSSAVSNYAKAGNGYAKITWKGGV